ncbi:CD209 antigen-like protein C [Enoplosus armatus]|uniref:CD209 antigen-like protein C n=1 Tax=Enoplosus armatus TaxID=215367 RepID=UPI003993C9C0
MSVAFNSKSGEAGGDGWNLMASDERSKYGRRCQSSMWWIGAAVVCLGLLLLTVILVAHNTSAISHWETKYESWIYNLTKDRDALRDERDQLKIHSSNLTKEMEVLQSQYNTVAASRDKLQEEVNRLNISRTGTSCDQGWTKFNNKCYYFSRAGVTKTWENSRKDCQERGANLATIATRSELDFVTRSHGITWIGLSDKEQENKWKWVDGTDLVGTGFWQDGEPNNSDGNEDCAEASRSAMAWNDVPCSRKFSWVCETVILSLSSS